MKRARTTASASCQEGLSNEKVKQFLYQCSCLFLQTVVVLTAIYRR